ncbi:transcriptional regulator FtrA [Pseudomonas veronii]|uniref:transcriptional regulator FtrA n=1 Tax=Pseudomonas veronii TaxID=76761 RepID=UPI0007C80E61|nr:transcriptional regulator FtrA [Pseudomonas veronii]
MDVANGKNYGPNVVCLIADELLAFEFGIAYEVFGLPRPEFEDDWYQFGCAAVQPGTIRSSGGLPVYVERGLESLETADLIIIPGWPDIDSPVGRSVIDAVQRAHLRGARIASLCSGVIVLAEAGLLDNGKATTHWRFIDSIARRFPLVEFDPDVLYVDRGSILTAAGSAAGMDLCIHIVRRDFGVKRANVVARRLIMPPHREGGQSQFIPQPVPKAYEATRIGAVVEHMRQHLGESHPIEVLAQLAGMSLRTFQRRFEALTGLAPSAWLMRERLRVACELLEHTTEHGLEEIASLSGFGSLPTMRHHFRKTLKTSPRDYRRVFQGATSSQRTPSKEVGQLGAHRWPRSSTSLPEVHGIS